jgi:hypothetical protein
MLGIKGEGKWLQADEGRRVSEVVRSGTGRAALEVIGQEGMAA